MTRQRQRGIRASVRKLQQALAASGLKTQTALAERIADFEGLQNPPRGLVNKAFRGESIDPRSIERIAAVLGVEAWTLYPDSTETEHHNSSSPDQRPASPPDEAGRRPAWVVLLATLSLLLAAGLMLRNQLNQDPGAYPRTAAIMDAVEPQAPSSFVVLPIDSDSIGFDAILGAALQKRWRQLPAAIAGDTGSIDAQQIAEQPGVDYVIELRHATRGRWQELLINAHRPGSMQALWQEVFPLQTSSHRLVWLMEDAAATVANNAPDLMISAHSREAQRKYLAGREYLDRARTPGNVHRALTEFESAIRLDQNYGPAYAGLCEALVVEHIRTGEMSRLDEAGEPCRQALELEPDLPEALMAQAMLDRKSGRPGQAMHHIQHALQRSPDHVDAALGKAELLLGTYARGENPEGLIAALDLLERASRLEPSFWKIPYQQARFSYMAGDLGTALSRADRAVELDANPLALNNLGTLQFCAGDFSAAKISYQIAGNIDPETFIGVGQVAVIDYFLGRFDEAVEGFAAALEKHRQSGAAEDHRLWGNYADALRHADRLDEARLAYARATALAERHVHNGDAHPMHAVAAAYNLTMLRTIDPNAPELDSEQLASLRSQSDRLDAIYKIYLAIVHDAQGLDEQARDLLESGSRVCPGLAISPDVVSTS